MNAEELTQLLTRRLREQGSDPILSAEKTVTQLCGKVQDRDPSDRAVYRALRAAGLSIAEAGHALRIAAALRTNSDLVHRLEPEEGSSKPCKRNRSQAPEDKKRKKPKI